MNDFINILKMFIDSKETIALYLNPDDPNMFVVGEVLNVSEEYFLIKMTDPYGRHDGYLLNNIEDITKIETDSIYLNKLLQISDQLSMNIIFSDKEDILHQVLTYLYEHEVLATFSFLSSEHKVIGYIQSIQDGLIFVKQINNDGKVDGKVIFQLDYLSWLTWDTDDETRLSKLENIN
ncbi:hypothetical protein [Acholeplasma hippikon]|uniref:Uncharacterized protein n=1 Tax=Acholeplasma hippikon TaxID=264636 RepID=A0A449BIH0_9MOLU|nr:hypothetical protein [Acholeplasma hippikon]VEU82137.1 Uncharacterised protein [Acholeplasma hippikon]